jgi:hypothetical protein
MPEVTIPRLAQQSSGAQLETEREMAQKVR